MPRRLSFSAPKLDLPSFTAPRAPTSAPRSPSSPQGPTAPRSPGRDTFETRPGGPSNPQPRTSNPPADDDGFEVVGPKKKNNGPKTFDPDRRVNQSRTEIDQKLSSAAANRGDMYGSVNVQRSDLGRLHGDLRAQYHNKPVPGYPNERYYVTAQQAQRKGGGFNITSHQFNKNGVDTTIRDGTPPRFNIHVLPQ
jgi:hypothetical protein